MLDFLFPSHPPALCLHLPNHTLVLESLSCVLHMKDQCYELNVCVLLNPPPNSYTPSVPVLGDEASKEVITFKWSHKDGAYKGVHVKGDIRATPSTLYLSPHPSLSPCMHQGEAIWGHTKKADIYKPGRKVSPETDPDSFLTLEFRPPKLWEKTFPLFRLSSLVFVMAARTDQNNQNKMKSNFCNYQVGGFCFLNP